MGVHTYLGLGGYIRVKAKITFSLTLPLPNQNGWIWTFPSRHFRSKKTMLQNLPDQMGQSQDRDQFATLTNIRLTSWTFEPGWSYAAAFFLFFLRPQSLWKLTRIDLRARPTNIRILLHKGGSLYSPQHCNALVTTCLPLIFLSEIILR